MLHEATANKTLSSTERKTFLKPKKTVFHSTCTFCVYDTALYWPTLQFYVRVYVSFVCRYMAPPGECYYNTLLCCDYFSSSSVVPRTYSALRVYSKFGHHPHPLGYLCANFLYLLYHCWPSPRRKIAYSINHSPYLMPREPKLAFWNKNHR